MITRGEIISVNYNSNIYVVRIPLFETAAINNPVTVEAVAIIPPGVFNGYVAGDMVEVGFENNAINKAVILGKLYLGAAKETTQTGGSIYGDALKITKNAELPVETKLTIDQTQDVASTTSSLSGYSSIKDIIIAINKLQQLVGEESVEAQIKKHLKS